MYNFDPYNWFWVVGGDDTRAWSSASGSYVSDYAADRMTRIDSEASLSDVLRSYGLAVPAHTQSDYETAIQSHIDSTAAARNYRSGESLAGYVSSTVPQWAAEASIFVEWRDAVWVYAYAELAKVQNGERPQPSVSDFLAELPSIVWA